MSLNKKLDKMFEEDFKKIKEEELEEENITGGGEAYDTPKAFKKKKKKTEESTFIKMAKLITLPMVSRVRHWLRVFVSTNLLKS